MKSLLEQTIVRDDDTELTGTILPRMKICEKRRVRACASPAEPPHATIELPRHRWASAPKGIITSGAPTWQATPKCDDLVACPAGTVEACILPLFEQEKAAGSTLLLLRSVFQVTEFSGDCGFIDRANHAQLSVFP